MQSSKVNKYEKKKKKTKGKCKTLKMQTPDSVESKRPRYMNDFWFVHFGPFQQPAGAKQPGHCSKSTDTTYECTTPTKEYKLYLLPTRF